MWLTTHMESPEWGQELSHWTQVVPATGELLGVPSLENMKRLILHHWSCAPALQIIATASAVGEWAFTCTGWRRGSECYGEHYNGTITASAHCHVLKFPLDLPNLPLCDRNRTGRWSRASLQGGEYDKRKRNQPSRKASVVSPLVSLATVHDCKR